MHTRGAGEREFFEGGRNMDKNWLPLQSIPPGGSAFRVDDQSFWQRLIKEFDLDIQIVEPLDAEVSILPQAQGVLFRGRLTGRVAMPCDRCSGVSQISLDQSFDSFEPFPRAAMAPGAEASDGEEEFDDADEAVIRLAAHGKGLEINPAALAWEEFSLALPLKPLCGPDCKGLCPICGRDKNTESCSCGQGQGDPRLAALRGITIEKK